MEATPSLTTLNLLNTRLGKEGGKPIAKALEANKTLTSINLLKNGFSMETSQALAKVAKEHATLRTLCGLEPEQMSRMLDLLEDFLHLASCTFERLDGNVKGEERHEGLRGRG